MDAGWGQTSQISQEPPSCLFKWQWMRTYSKKLSPSQSPYWRPSTVPFSSDSTATGPAVAVEGFTSGRCLEVANAPTLETLSSPVVAENGEQLKICGLSNVSLWVGDLCVCCPILLVKSIMQNCLTCDRLSGKNWAALLICKNGPWQPECRYHSTSGRPNQHLLSVSDQV